MTQPPSLNELIIKQDGQISQWLHIPTSRQIVFGDGPGCDFFIRGVPPTQMFDERGGLSATARSLSARSGVGALLRPAPCTEIYVRSTLAPTQQPNATRGRPQVSPYVLGSALLHVLVLILIFRVSPTERSLELDAQLSTNQYVSAQVIPTEEKPDEHVPTLWSEKMRGGLLGEREGMMHGGASGAMGKRSATHRNGLYQIAGETSDPHPAKISSSALASQAGIIAIIKGSSAEASPFASVFGHDQMIGDSAETILGGLYGYEPGEAEGGYGLGLRGAGLGAGYTGEGTLGAGRYGLGRSGRGGSCDDTCSGMGLGYGGRVGGGIGLGEKEETHKAGAPEVTYGKADIVGSYDKDNIRRVIRRAMPGIKYCYEQALQKASNLEGKVELSFVIGPNGAVADARAISGIAPSVDQCVVQKIKNLSFPAPDGVVEVAYPFIFRSK